MLRWLFPQMSEAAIDVVVLIVRKCAHMGEYGILAMFLWRALRKPQRADPRPWSWRTAWVAVLLVAIYATTDEIHQHYVPGRDANARDVLIDTCGAVGGIIFVWAFRRWRAQRREQKGASRNTKAGADAKRQLRAPADSS